MDHVQAEAARVLHFLSQSRPSNALNISQQVCTALSASQEQTWFEFTKTVLTPQQEQAWHASAKSTLGSAYNYAYNNPGRAALLAVQLGLLANPVALAGFGATGPVGGSLAATWQAMYGGNVAAGSLFAMLQSFGMNFPAAAPIVGAAGFIPEAVMAGVKRVVPEAAQETIKKATKETLKKAAVGSDYVKAGVEASRDELKKWWKKEEKN